MPKSDIPSFCLFYYYPRSTKQQFYLFLLLTPYLQLAQNGEDVIKDLWEEGHENPYVGTGCSRENKYPALIVVCMCVLTHTHTHTHTQVYTVCVCVSVCLYMYCTCV